MVMKAGYTTGPGIHLLVEILGVRGVLAQVLGVVEGALAVVAERRLGTLPNQVLQKKKYF